MNRMVLKPGLYFAIVFIVTYAFWIAGAFTSFQENADGRHMLFLLPGLLTPFLVSLVMILKSKNPAYKKEVADRIVNPKRIRLSMLPALVFLLPLAVLVSIAISLLFGGSAEQFQFNEKFSFSTGFVPVLLLLFLAAGFEELGWRGYAFDSLQSRFTIFTASIVFGILWSLWHLPLIWVKETYQYEILHQNAGYALNFFIAIVPMGVISSWIWLRNRKSILVAMAFHFFANFWNEALAMTQQTKCIQSAVITAIAITIILCDKELFFSRTHLNGGAK
ncbi:CPBP family intramembrane metalloprotease [candidate division KSB1 bacterium]|nr:CPBP family intramembrane metalloprotease [candidate division KSB1 bacterium]